MGSANTPEYYAPEHLVILPFQAWKGLLPGDLPAGMVDQAARYPAANKALIVERGLGALGITRGALTNILVSPTRATGLILHGD